MKISISALSIAYGLTPEALRYYEEKGLLTPERTASSGFRKYTLEDVKRLGIIKSMQRQGFSLEEIRSILTGCPRAELIGMMDEKRRQLREQISLSSAIYNRLIAAADLMRDSAKLDLQPRLAPGCAAYVLDYDSFSAMWGQVTTSQLLRSLIDALPLSSYTTVVPREMLAGQDAHLRYGVCVPAEYLTVVAADFSQMHMCAGPQTVRVAYELRPPERRTILPAVEAARAFLKEQGLTPVCPAYTREYAWLVDEHGQKRHFSELIVPAAKM